MKQVSQKLYIMFYPTKKMKQNKFDKIFKITVLGLLALILIFQISSTISLDNTYFFGEDYIVDMGHEDFLMGSEIFTEQKSLYSSYDIYTYKEFGNLVNKSINNNEDLKDYAKENAYKFYNENPFFLTIEIGKECTHDKIRDIELCIIKSIEANAQNNQIILSSNTDFEEIDINSINNRFYEE